MLRKQILEHPTIPSSSGDEINVPAVATVLVTSESTDHPIEHVFDGSRGPGGTRWVAALPGEQTVILVFDEPQSIRRIIMEAEEQSVSRTQELAFGVSQDGGQTYRELLRQEFNFSPTGTTFEREEWAVSADNVTHLRLSLKPDKGNQMCVATLTTLALQ
jgi:hypothetical protein